MDPKVGAPVRGVRPFAPRAALALSVPLLGAVACLDHAPTQALDGLRLTISTTIAAAVGNLQLSIAATYRRAGAVSVPLDVTQPAVSLEPGDNSVPVMVDAGPCLRDAIAGETENGTACLVRLQLTLTDDQGVLDIREVMTPDLRAVNASGGTASVVLPAVTLGGVAAIDVTPNPATIIPVDSVLFSAIPRTLSGRALATPVTWTSQDPGVASIGVDGRARAVAVGSTTISATSGGSTVQVPLQVRPWTEAEALPMWTDVWDRLRSATTAFSNAGAPFVTEGVFLFGGLLADEFRSGDTFTQRDETDRRSVSAGNAMVNANYARLVATDRAARIAIAAHTMALPGAATPDAVHVGLANLYLVAGFVSIVVAEHFCAGATFVEVDPLSGRRTFGSPMTRDQLLDRAVLDLTLALNHALGAGSAPGADLARNSALVARARAHLARDRNPEAIADASQVPLSFGVIAVHDAARPNAYHAVTIPRKGYSVGDLEGGVGLNFATSGDPRLPVVPAGFAFNGALFPFQQQQKYPEATAPVYYASGFEAQLLMAEAQLAQGNSAAAAAHLNAVRTPYGLPPFTAQQVTIDVVMRERAFTLWGTGQRIGDLRRLVRRYGRSPSAVFPSGAYYLGGTYGADMNLPISPAGDANPNFVGCLDRNP